MDAAAPSRRLTRLPKNPATEQLPKARLLWGKYAWNDRHRQILHPGKLPENAMADPTAAAWYDDGFGR